MELPEIMEGINYIAWMKPKQYFFWKETVLKKLSSKYLFCCQNIFLEISELIFNEWYRHFCNHTIWRFSWNSMAKQTFWNSWMVGFCLWLILLVWMNWIMKKSAPIVKAYHEAIQEYKISQCNFFPDIFHLSKLRFYPAAY